ncbi:Down syndrome cell adhesion molecule-like protein Dscam2 [Vespula squamosa]|uniref:Down syndrome cell adhesion molecule-like protein Dscam2 n=1 Tax=Vespula squamosa TaxID=30214 RepID=A0ABD2C635_VESSQ
MIGQQVKISPCCVLPRGSQFQLIEPVATKKPKFSSDFKFAGYDRVVDQDLTLLCPAQGFPVPTYRRVQIVFFFVSQLLCAPLGILTIVEPVTTKKPKLSSDFKMAWYDRIVDQDLTLFCPAKGFPVPTYRRIVFSCHVSIVLFVSLGNLTIVEPVATKKPKFSSDSKFAGYDRLVDQDLTLLCPAQGFPVPTYRGSQFQPIEPVATKKPKFSSDAKKSWYDRVVGQDLTLFCPAQGFPVPTYRYFYTKYLDREVEKRLLRHILLSYLSDERACFLQCLSVEPVGSKAPALTGNLKGGWMENKAGSSIVLTCPAQGYPVPSFRCIISLFPFSSHGFPVPTDGRLFKFTSLTVLLYFLLFALLEPVGEPVGSKAPTLTGGDVKGIWMEKGTNSSVVLQCPAQAYPVPSFRTCRRQSTSIDGQRNWRYNEQPSRLISRVVLSSSGLSRTYERLQIFSFYYISFTCLHSKPVGSKAPTFTSELRGGWLKKRANSNTVLTCPAQGHPVPMFRVILYPVLEPVGSKAPSILGEKGSLMERRTSTDIVIPCQGQGYPVPTFSIIIRSLKSVFWVKNLWGVKRLRLRAMPNDGCRREPVGSKAPAFQSEAKSVTYVKHAKSSVALTCSAQASPPPNYRPSLLPHLEPVNGAKPRVASTSKYDVLANYIGASVTMLCPAQGHPLPAFRYLKPVNRAAPKVPPTAKITVLALPVQKALAMLCQAQANPLPVFRYALIQVEPIGSSPPRLPPRSKFDGMMKVQGQAVTLLCEAQGSPIPFYRSSETRWSRVFESTLLAEPRGSVRPNVKDKDVNSMKKVISVNEMIGLICPVQGFPAPAFSRIFESTLLAEPTGNVPPRIAGERYEGGKLVDVPKMTTAALDCATQGFPVPVTRGYHRDSTAFLGQKIRGMGSDILFSGSERCFQSLASGISHTFDKTLSFFKSKEPSGRTAPKGTGDGLNKYRGVEGESLALACAAQGFPAPITRWYKFIEGSSRRQPVQLNDRVRQVSGTLIIREARVEDSGKYLCIVNNSVGGESVETVLTVTAPLAAEIEPSTQTVDFGRPATFTCNVRGNPIKTISWLKDGKPLGLEEPVLRIESVKKEDKGMYQCFVRNDQESAQATAELKLGGRFEPPQIRQAFTEETLQPGPSMFLKCVASGNPTPEITWELDGKRLSNTERGQVGQYVTVNGDVVSHLNISSIHTNDGGLYKCIAASKVGSAEHSARLNVYGLPFIRHMDKKAIVAGETLRVTCPVAGYPIESIVWERDTRVLPINRKQKVFPNGTLIIENVERMSDQATYTCVARNAQGYSARGTLEVQVMVPPTIQEFAFMKLPMNAGEFANLQCIVPTGDLPLNIRWSYPGEEMGGSSGVLAKKVADRVSMLMISVITAKHAGDPQLLPIAFNTEVANWGDFVSVPCSILKGDMPMDISWSFNGVPIDTSKDTAITISKISNHLSTLSIDSVSARHAGEYACSASNLAGAVSRSATLTVNVAPQIIPFDFGDESANWGELVSVTCSITKGDQPLDISWAFNGTPIDTSRGSDVVVASTNKKNSVLTIESVAARHAGEYTCSASNRAGAASHTALLTVNVAPQILQFSFGDTSLNSGEMLSVGCTIVKGDFPVTLTWTFNEIPINSSQHDIHIVTSKRVSFLNIDNVAARHAGTYKCIATNAAGSDSHTAILSVNVAPQIGPFSFGDEAANAGEMATVQCAVIKGDLPVDIVWSLNGQPIDVTDAQTNQNYDRQDIIVSRSNKRASTLTIDSVAARHAGEYSCTASNAAGSATHSSVLSVNVPPRIAPFEMADKAVNSGESVSAVCTIVSGDSPLEITWALNGMPVEESQRISVTTTKRNSLLSIDSASPTHAGTYTCVASNAAGATTYSAVLTVNGTLQRLDQPTQLKKLSPEIAPFDIAEKPANWGDSISVVCAIVKGDVPIEISWALNGEPIGPDRSDINILATTRKNSILSIESVAARHAGEYTCSASNKAGATSHSSTLVVNVAPEIAPFVLSENPSNWGQTVTATCTILQGDQPVQIEWALNGKSISHEYPDISIATTKRVSLLTIEAVTASHAGEYTCIASNVAGGTSYTATLAVNVAPVIMSFEMGEGPTNWGQTVTATCTILQGDQPIQMEWALNGKPISHDYPDISIATTKRVSLLTIEAVTASHAGEYTCIASNMAGGTSYTATLAVNVAPVIMPFEMGEEPANWGQTVTATCTILQGDQPVLIEWAFNGKPISHDYPDISITIIKRVSLLTIEAVTASHAGEYTCIASNAAGGTSYSATLAVYVAPVIMPFEMGEGPANWGDTVTATCTVLKGDRPVQIEWALNGEPISRDRSDVWISTNERVSLLTIDAVTERHAGEYTCTASNVAGGTSYSASLAVNVVPHIAPFSISDGPANWGDMVSATCSIMKGDFPVNIVWKFNDKTIGPDDSDITITKINKHMSALSIESVTARHAGEYICVATNRAGNATHSTTLAVNGTNLLKARLHDN